MNFIKQFCLSCSAFCTLYRDMNVPVQILEDDTYILLKEVTPYSTDSEEFFEQQGHENQYYYVDLAREYGIKMLSKYTRDRIS